MLAKNSFGRKFLKWALIIFIGLAVVLFGIGWYLNLKYKPVITQEIVKAISKSTNGLYKISFSNVVTNIITGHALLKNVNIEYDSTRYKELIKLQKAPNNLYKITLKKVVIKKFHPFDILFIRKLNIDQVLFDKPNVVMINKQFDFNDEKAPAPEKSPYEYISDRLNEFSIQDIFFDGVSFKYINNNGAKPKAFSIADLDISLKDFLIDEYAAKDPERIYLLKDAVISLNKYTYLTPDGFYKLKLKKLNFTLSTGELDINNLRLEPLYSEMDFGKKLGYRKDRFDIRVDKIKLNGIDALLYLRKQELVAKEMLIDDGAFNVFTNENLPKLDSNSKVGKYPHQLLQKMALPIFINEVKLNNIAVNYAIYSKRSKLKGVLSFDHTQGIVSNLTNMPKYKAQNGLMKASLNSNLMGEGKLSVNFEFNLLANNGAFLYKGALHSFNARSLNRITKPLGLIQINRGYVDNLDFSFKADDLKSIGKLRFWYYNLSVALMRNDEEKGRLVKMGLMSFLANALMINSENPKPNGEFTIADVAYERPANTSFFNMIWKSLYLGIKHSVGLTNEKQLQMQNNIAKLKAISESRKARQRKKQQAENQSNIKN